MHLPLQVVQQLGPSLKHDRRAGYALGVVLAAGLAPLLALNPAWLAALGTAGLPHGLARAAERASSELAARGVARPPRHLTTLPGQLADLMVLVHS